MGRNCSGFISYSLVFATESLNEFRVWWTLKGMEEGRFWNSGRGRFPGFNRLSIFPHHGDFSPSRPPFFPIFWHFYTWLTFLALRLFLLPSSNVFELPLISILIQWPNHPTLRSHILAPHGGLNERIRRQGVNFWLTCPTLRTKGISGEGGVKRDVRLTSTSSQFVRLLSRDLFYEFLINLVSRMKKPRK